jgi:hypothetical protein
VISQAGYSVWDNQPEMFLPLALIRHFPLQFDSHGEVSEWFMVPLSKFAISYEK